MASATTSKTTDSAAVAAETASPTNDTTNGYVTTTTLITSTKSLTAPELTITTNEAAATNANIATTKTATAKLSSSATPKTTTTTTTTTKPTASAPANVGRRPHTDAEEQEEEDGVAVADDAASSVQLRVPDTVRSEPTTLQLVLSARAAAEARAREEAEREAAAAAAADGSNLRRGNPSAVLRLPHLREPNKEPEPTDPDFAVKLGAFMERAGDDCLPRLLQREFPEPGLSPRLLERLNGTRGAKVSASTPTSPLSPNASVSPALSPVPTPRDFKWAAAASHGVVTQVTGSGVGAGGGHRRASLTLRRRRESTQLLKGPDYLAPVPGSSYVTETESGLARFKRIARTVKVVVKVCNALKSFVERTDSHGWSFVEMYLHVQEDMHQDLAFDPQNFSVSQPLNGGPRLQRLLRIPPENRTSQDVQQILSILRSHSGFSDFPVQVQIQLCRAVQYEMYESRRILLRQGHQPTAFYMLLTGSLMVNIRDVHPSSGHVFIRTVSDLKEGDCFGELALLEQTPRTATIISKTAVELVSLPKEDFDRIIRQPLLRLREQNVSHCQKHLLFQDFPCDVFCDNPDDFFFQYCPAGLVAVKNGQRCAYLVFVKSGKCNLVGSYSITELTRKRLEAASHDAQKAFPLYTEILKLTPAHRRRPGTHPESAEENDKTEMDLLTHIMGGRRSKSALQAKRDLGVRVQEYLPPPRPVLHKSRTLTTFYDKLQKERRQKLMSSEDPGSVAQEAFWDCRLQGPVLQKPKSVRIKTEQRPDTVAGSNVRKLEFLRPDKEGFAQIAQLNAGDVFGLETLVKRQASRVSMVSQGAELIFISKKLFLQHANIRVLRVVNDMSITYPNAVDIHDKLKHRREWNRYKHALVRHVVTRAGRDYEPPSCQA